MFSRLKLVAVCSLALLLGACNQHGRGASQTAILFFDALYVQQDLDRALAVSGDQMAEVLSHYGDVELIQEHLLGLTFDSAQKVSTIHRRTLMLEEHRNMVDVTVFLNGFVDGYSFSEDRKVRMRRIGDRWYVEDFLNS